MVWTCRLHTIPQIRVPEIEDYCYKAALNDPTFKFTVEGCTIEGENMAKVPFIENIIIECESRDQAHKRGMLFHHKFGVYYEVEWKKDVS